MIGCGMMKTKVDRDEFLVLLAIVGCIVGSFYFTALAYVGLALAMICVVSFEVTNIFFLCFFLMPFAQIFKTAPNSTSFFTMVEFAFLAKIMVVKEDYDAQYVTNVGGFVFYIMFLGIALKQIDILLILKMLSNLSLLYFFIDQYQECDCQRYIFFYSSGLVLSSLVGLFKDTIPKMSQMFVRGIATQYVNGAQVTRFSGTFADPNYYSIAIIVCVGLIIAFSFCYGIKAQNVIWGVTLAVFGLMTYSKSYLLMLVMLSFFALWIMLKKGLIGQTLFLIYNVPLLLTMGVLQNNRFISGILFRLTNTSEKRSGMNAITTGRWGIWEKYFAHFLSKKRILLFGEGLGAPYLGGIAMHNIFVEMIYYVGVVGSFLFLCSLVNILQHRSLNNQKTILNQYLYICIWIMYIFLAGFTSFELPFYFMLGWVVYNTRL